MFRLQLQAVGYPLTDQCNVEDSRQAAALVVWLENQVVRVWKDRNDERSALSRVTDDAAWPRTFHSYLTDLDYPTAVSVDDVDKWAANGGIAEAVVWLVRVAVAAAYRNDAAALTDMAASQGSLIALAERRAAKERLSGVDSEEFRAALAAFVPALQLEDVAAVSDARTLARVIANLVRRKYSPGAIGAAADESSARVVQDLRTFNLGLEIGDADLDAAAAVLRLLYISDLRELQTAINEALTQLQSVTANPKTNAALGKVGK